MIDALEADDVILTISQSGFNHELNENIKLAGQRNIKIVGICPEDSDLAHLSNICIAINVKDKLQLYGYLTSRVVHLVILDILAVGVAIGQKIQHSK